MCISQLPVAKFLLLNLERLQLESIGLKDDLVLINDSSSAVESKTISGQFCFWGAVPRETKWCPDFCRLQYQIVLRKFLFVDCGTV